ncbi:hypothetical protein F7F24_27460, partial [Escherichia coli]
MIRWLLKKRTNGSVRYCQYTSQSATDTLSSPVPETDAVETAIPDNEKTECKVEVEPSVEREGPFYFLF